jgi:N,N'-diacetyllegionaminate synthase
MRMEFPVNSKIIAEIGLSHEGSLGQSHAFIDAVKNSGADIVKFQIHIPEFESSKIEKFRINFSTQDRTRMDYWSRTAFSKLQFGELYEHASELNLGFCVSVFSGQAVEWARDLDIKFIKIGSGDMGNGEIIDSLDGFKGEVILSSGMSTWNEIEIAISKFQSRLKSLSKLTLLQCTSLYPTPLSLTGINVMNEMKNKFPEVDIGLSDHTPGINSALVALTYGAKMLEKHVTFSKFMFGPDIKSSIDFHELSQLVSFRNDLSKIMTFVDKDLVAEKLTHERNIFGRSLGLKFSYPSGHLLDKNDFCLRKPAGGYSWEERIEFIGRKLLKPYSNDEILLPEHLGTVNSTPQGPSVIQ